MKITKKQIKQIWKDGNSLTKVQTENWFPKVFDKELSKYHTGWIKTKSPSDEKYIGYSEEGVIKYGISSDGNWFEGNDGEISNDDYRASKSEVLESLKNEAIRRGYGKKNYMCLDLPDSTHKIKRGTYHFETSDNRLFHINTQTNKANIVFNSGVWAKIIIRK